MPRASFNLYASAALRSYARTDQNESKTDHETAAGVHVCMPGMCRVWGLFLGGISLGTQWTHGRWRLFTGVQLVSSHKAVGGTGRCFCSYLSDLLPQHGGTGVDDKHHVLGNSRQVFGGEVVDKVSV